MKGPLWYPRVEVSIVKFHQVLEKKDFKSTVSRAFANIRNILAIHGKFVLNVSKKSCKLSTSQKNWY